MSDDTTVTRTENDAALDAGRELAVLAADPVFIDRHTDSASVSYVVPAGYTVHTQDLTKFDIHRDRPRWTSRDVKVLDVASFAAYIERHNGSDGDAYLEVYANPDTMTVTAILDAPNHGVTSWAEHRVHMVTEKTAEFRRWTAASSKPMSQAEFADLVETGIPEIAEPDGSTLLNIVSTFVGQKAVDYESSVRLDSGETNLVYKETITGSAGKAGDLRMPAYLVLGLRPWKASPRPVRFTARLRYRINRDKQLELTYILDRVEETLEAAWAEVVAQVEAAVPAGVLTGVPPA